MKRVVLAARKHGRMPSASMTVHPHRQKIIQVADQGRAIEQRATGRAAGASG